MEPAQSHFFNLPELINLLASLLSKRDLSRLMQTSRQLHATCRPTFFREIDLVQEHKTLCDNKDGFYALVRNAESVQSLKLNPKSGKLYKAYAYILGVLQDTDNKPTTSALSSLHRPVLPGSCCHPYSDSDFLIGLRSTLQLSHRLSELHLHRVRIEQESWIHRLATTISEIVTLQTLHLTIFSGENIQGTIASTIFFSCPPLVRTLSIEVFKLHLATYRVPADTLQEEPLIRRDEPLHCLTDFTMAVNHRFQFLDIVSILEHCPELVSMNVPTIQPGDSLELALRILDLCPSLRNLSLHDCSDAYAEHVMFVIMIQMPKDSLRSCSYNSFREKSSVNSLATSIGWHFDSLRSVRLIECARIHPEQVQAILFNCPVLEVFVITEASDHELDISVGDLVEETWASTGLVELTLPVNIGTLENPRYQKRSHLTKEEREQVLLLEKLYHQLGSLIALRVLSLSVLMSADVLDMASNPLEFRDYTFPGLLVQGDDDDDEDGEDRWGCLQELARLQNLEVVRGSFNTKAWMPAGYEFEKRDVEFITAHWPRLRSIEFVLPSHYADVGGDNLGSHPYIVWLRRQLPHVKIVFFRDSPRSRLVDEIKGVDFD
ncbi:hypothetical protein EC957_002568 [Mortierella hygrophila]|uniref:F-box domain-containing protein n=1 Tax=Mortierella hygrophila TaxID=979708 RepID=A0A9P6F468_9FUNG|nr:hypothetical protein EC957_002568 [Mortierella hygrophila]